MKTAVGSSPRLSVWRPLIIGVVLLTFRCASGQTAATNQTPEKLPPESLPTPEFVSFPAGSMTLQGWIYKPAGKGPFPAVLYNHGSDKAPGWFPTLGEFWTSKGYVFFVPHRRGHGRSPGEWIVDLQQQFREKESDVTVTRKHDIE